MGSDVRDRSRYPQCPEGATSWDILQFGALQRIAEALEGIRSCPSVLSAVLSLPRIEALLKAQARAKKKRRKVSKAKGAARGK